ncbi:MAG: CoB--CoM heterodisulfide reductase iron-sulfur subunit A family protein [Calditrichaeota bacterium]|jgi:quinone-modifying oxidoreductase, subunit QmoA|nr:CoB--CoM heterodisulfide reductase iron-sulfur subunit A family protein [Calditrichota bacterium]
MKTDLLVVGGGIAGITAAVEAAEVGKDVILIEREHYLGGRVVQLHRYFPKICPPTCGLEINFRRIRQNPKITVLTGAEATKIDGKPGAYTADVNVEPRYVTEACTNCGDCAEACEIEVDDNYNFGLTKAKAIRLANDNPYPNRYFIDSAAVNDPKMKALVDICPPKAIDLDMKAETVSIEAKSVIYTTGWEPYDASKLEGLNYGVLPNVVTNMMFERMTAIAVNNEAKVVRPSDGASVSKIAFVQCAGSRDRSHLPYCSAICCMASLKQTRYIRDQYPDAEIHVFFIDARTPGRWEDFYQNVQDDTKTIIHRGKVAKVDDAGDGNVTVIAENTLTGNLEKITVEMAVLATGMVPSAKTTKPLLDSKQDEFGFIWPGGVIAAGVATGPKDVAGSNQDATAAVARAMQDMVEV